MKKLGLLTMAMGVLEWVVIAMHCKVTGKTEEELDLYGFNDHRKGLDEAVKKLDWTDAQKVEFSERLPCHRNER